jgi:hypothetical protein
MTEKERDKLGRIKGGKKRAPDDPPDWRSKPRKPLTVKKTCVIALRCTALEHQQINDMANHYEMSMTELLLEAVKNYIPQRPRKR